MSLNHQRKCIFIHIIKTGGTSIERALGMKKTHQRASYYRKMVGINKWNNYFKFSFVRNPWDKMVSQFHYNGHLFAKNKTFEEYIRMWDNGHKISTFPPFNSYYLDLDLDFIGKFENLQGDFDVVCEKIGIPQKRLPHMNKSKHRRYTEYYSPETIEIVGRKFGEDIRRLGYKFGD